MKLSNISEEIFCRLFRIALWINASLLISFIYETLSSVGGSLAVANMTIPFVILFVFAVCVSSDVIDYFFEVYRERSLLWKVLPVLNGLFLWIIY